MKHYIKSSYLQTLLICSGVLGCLQNGISQNIVPNPSFETFTSCPPGFGQGGALEATPWQSATLGTSDYFNECASPIFVGIPVNFFGNQAAHTGAAYAGGYYKYSQFLYREYIQAPLNEPLQAGFGYQVSFWVSLSETSCGVENFGVYFSATPPPSQGFGPLAVTPQVTASIGYISDYDNWVLITGCFIPDGGEQWITIGNFEDDANSPNDPTCNFTTTAYYYVDDVSVVQGGLPGLIDVELGDPVFACESYEVDPGLNPHLHYNWSDGSHNPTLVVIETGTYVLTVTDGCSQGIDSVEVTIAGVAEVDLGPEEAVICSGESYDISLDPDVGTYEWQDGSTDPDYSITTTGLYGVTLDDGCDLSDDEIFITVIEPPASFSLGPDTYLCDGDQIEYDFDPALGDFTWQDNTTSPYYSITEPGNYALTISNICGEYSDDIEITPLEAPVVFLGPVELYLCNGQIYDIELDPDMGFFLWHDGSDQNFYTITGPGIYAVTVTNPCGTDSEQIEVFYLEEPQFDLGDDITVCPSQLPFILDLSSTPYADAFLWQNGSIEPQFEVTAEGTYSVTVSNLCAAISDEVQVIVEDESPVVNLPPDQILCTGETLILTSNNIPGDYLWQDGSTSDEFIVTGSGTYSLTITNDCGSGTDSIEVDYTDPLLPPDLGADISLCPGETYILYAGVSNVLYEWQDFSSADSLLITGPGTYSLTISDGCTIASDMVIVSADGNPPVVDLPSSLNLCQSQTLILDAGISGVQFLWNDGSQLSTLSVMSPGSYSLTVSNSCGSDVDSVIIIDGGPAPIVTLGTDIELCPGESFLLAPPSSDVVSWLWQDGSVGSSFNITGPGTITVEVTNNCGMNQDTLLVSLLADIPPLDLGADTSLCSGEPLSLSINIPGVDILWSDGTNGNVFDINGPGLYFAEITNECGTSFDTLSVLGLPSPPTLNLGSDQSLCPGETITFSPGLINVDYLWQDGSIGNSFDATAAGLVILTISNECGVEIDSVLIIENTDGPVVNLGPDVIACEGETVTLISDIGGVTYLWQDGSNAMNFIASASGTYYLQVSNSCGSDTDTVMVEIDGVIPSPQLGTDTTLCEGSILQLISNADAGTMIEWQNGSVSSVFVVSTPGIYSLAESNHCGQASDTIVISFLAAPQDFNLGPDAIICPGESIVLAAPVTPGNITWQDGSNASTFVANNEQVYWLQLSNNCGTETDSMTINLDDNIPILDIDSPIPWCNGDLVTLDATQVFDAIYLWDDGSSFPSLQVVTPGEYAVSVMTDCYTVDQEVMVVPGDCSNEIYVPSVFSPNEDGFNDVFTIFFGSDLDITGAQCSVYDRWGNMVFDTQTLPVAWDGRFRDSDMSPGVYAYVIIAEYMDRGRQRREVIRGDITLIR